MKKYSKLLAVFLVLALIVPAIASADFTSKLKVERIAGKNRIETAIKVSQKSFKDGTADTVVLAGYNGEADALTGTLLAKDKNAPMLLTKKDKLEPELVAEMQRLGTKKVYILGGEKVVFEKVEADLKVLELEVVRLKGSTRVETATKIVREVFKDTKPTEAFVVEYNALPDALAIGPVSAGKKAPIVISNKDKVPTETEQLLKDMEIKDLTIVGGDKVLTKKGKEALEKITGKSAERVSGSSRIETALAVANKYYKNPKAIVIANGYIFADALVGGYFAELQNAPILLVNKDSITDNTKDYIKNNQTNIFVLGGNGAVSKGVFDQIEEQAKLDNKTQEAIAAVEEVEAKVLTAELVVKLVEDKDSLEDVKVLYDSALVKVNKLKGTIKDNLVERLEEVNNKLTAVGLVNELQAATKDLTEANLAAAKEKLEAAKAKVETIKDEEIKAALMKLINIEEDKIIAFEKDLEDNLNQIERVEKMIERLPEPIDLTIDDAEDVGNARDAFDALNKEQKQEVKNAEKLTKVLEAFELIEEDYINNLG